MTRFTTLLILAALFLLGASAPPATGYGSFAPADKPGPFSIGYQRTVLVDPSRDAEFGGRALTTHIWYPLDAAVADTGIPVIYDAGLASLANFFIPVAYSFTRSTHGALVGPNSTLPLGAGDPGSCPPPPFPPNPADPCGTSSIDSLPVSTQGPFPLLMFSHGSFLSGIFYASTAEYLATHGYIVVAVDHTGNRQVDFYAGNILGAGVGGFDSCSVLLVRPCGDSFEKVSADRPRDISFALDRVLGGLPDLPASAINAHQIGATGQSFGGYTTLAVAAGTAGGSPKDPRIKAIAPLSAPASAATQPNPGFVPLVEEIKVPTLVSYGTDDTIFGIDFRAEGREIFNLLNTHKVRRKYRVEAVRGVHIGYLDTCSVVAGILEVIQLGNANPFFDFGNLGGYLTFDGQFPPLPPESLGKSKDGPQAICPAALFYEPANLAVWDTVTLVPPAPPIPLSALLFPENLIPGYLSSFTPAPEYVASLGSAEVISLTTTYVTAFFNRHLRGDLRYFFYLTPLYTELFQPDAQLEVCFKKPFGTGERCFDNIDE